MNHVSHGKPKVPWMVIAVIFYVTTFLALLAAAIVFGGPITAGLCVWLIVVAVHALLYVCINTDSQEH